jgi:hypothetical protein
MKEDDRMNSDLQEIEHVVLADRKIDPDNLIMDGIDDDEHPLFSVGEMAKVFFGMSTHWVRWIDKEPIYYNGEQVGNRRRNGARVYTLSDIEKMAHALAQVKRISVPKLRAALETVYAQAKVNEFL